MFLLTGRPTERVQDAMLHEAARLEALACDLRGIAAGTSPHPSSLGSAPVLNGWRRASRPTPCLVGLGSDHPRLPAGPIMTTGVWAMDPVLGWARTLSRYYALGPCAETSPFGRETGHE